MKKNFLSIILFLILLPLFSANLKLPKTTLNIRTVNLEEIPVKVEIAKTPEQRNHGFMERKNIPEGTGMIFIFDRDQILSFWMKNTPHPLSIAYIDSNGIIRDIFDMTPFSLSSIVSSCSVRYALEVPQGWFKKNNINPGDRVDVSILK